MKFSALSLSGAFCIELSPRDDARGRFTRLLCMDELRQIGHEKSIVQVNYSYSKTCGTVRGLHFQFPPHSEIKMITCLRGRVFDVVVDLRSGSPTFLKWQGLELTPENSRVMYIPEGCAHGFQTLEGESELIYFHTAFYTPSSEGGLPYDDEAIGIVWPLPIAEISKRDLSHPRITSAFKGLIP